MTLNIGTRHKKKLNLIKTSQITRPASLTLAALPRWIAMDNLCNKNDPERGSRPFPRRRRPTSLRKNFPSVHQHPVVSAA
jgi:hypothetical protein